MTPALPLGHPSLFKQTAFLAGEWAQADSGECLAVRNPATQTVIAQVPKMGQAETRRAIEAATAAWDDWKAQTAQARCAVVRRWFELMKQHQEDLARILTAEQGKPLAEARGEINYAASFLEWFSEEGKRAYGETIPSPWADKRILVLKQPIGVCAAITPWNFPAAMITRKAGAALAAGCPMIVKPASQTPLSALALAVLAEEAGIPKGVFSVLTGSAEAVAGTLATHPEVRKLSFTGSTEVGRVLMRQSADSLKKLSLELGGNAPFIVFEDADIDAAVEGAVIAKYRNTGQTCVCANRFLVQNSVYEAFAERLTSAVRTLKVGEGTEAGVQQGPLINQAAVDKVQEHLQDALEKGARLQCGGKIHSLGGTFFEPTVLTEATPQMLLAHEETFGPVAALFRFETEAEALALANHTDSGLAAYFYTRDQGRVWRMSEALEYGMVGVNTGMLSTEVAPFGGIKTSGLGREGSKYGLEEYLEIKYVCMAG